mgnify:CR=1 FL=1
MNCLHRISLLLLVTLQLQIQYCWSYVSPAIKEQWKRENYNVEKSLTHIEESAEEGQPLEELYGAVRFLDRNAHKFWNTDETKRDMFEKAKGCWELRLAYEDSRTEEFYPYPDFRDFAMAFTMIDDHYFGKGIAQNPSFCFVAMGGPATFSLRKRQLFMDYQDFFISGRQVPDWDLSFFMRGYAREWISTDKKKPPLAFTIIGVNEKVLVVRGSKTGGMAIFRRIKDDMRQAAYGSDWDGGGKQE